MYRSIVAGLIMLFWCSEIYCQQPKAGEPMPDFTLTNILNYKTRKANLKDFRGKWLVLDFWESGCVPCIKKFPDMHKFQAHFKDQIQFVLVGACDKTIKEGNWNNMPALISLYERISKKQQLDLANAYDSVLAYKWEISSYPAIFIVDPNGVLRYITEGRNMTIEKLQAMLNGKEPDFSLRMNQRSDFDMDTVMKMLQVDSSILHFSIFSKFNKEAYNVQPIDVQLRIAKNDTNYHTWGYTVTGSPLAYLYNTAYIGYPSMSHALFYKPEYVSIYYPLPVLEIKNKTPFVYDKKNEIGLYNYGIRVPRTEMNAERLMQLMQQDLKKYFGYTVSIEEREMPIWKLIAKPGAEKLLKTKGGKTYFRDEGASGGAAGIEWRNAPGKSLMTIVERFMDDAFDLPYVDETGIDYNIDIKIDADMSDRAQVQGELRKYGLDLVKSIRKYKVIVIRD